LAYEPVALLAQWVGSGRLQRGIISGSEEESAEAQNGGEKGGRSKLETRTEARA
jgi:hypothetical protein